MTASPRFTELLAPAGGPSQLEAAVSAGADAVYFGIDRLNMRVRAANFPLAELPEITSRLHGSDTRAYLTLNTLIFESELPLVTDILHHAKESGVDAVIAADWSVIRAARSIGIPVHISTQLSVSNSQTLAMLFELGIRRVVLARECSLQDLITMRENLQAAFGQEADELEFEVFAHGAMCVAESGRCFMSGLETGRSASRGDCAQPCRQTYHITSERGGDGFRLEGEHVLSPKDLCTLPFLDQILEAGVSSLKIEGRNRSPDYVHTVVGAYRKALDAYRSFKESEDFKDRFRTVTDACMTDVNRVYNRGFSSGYYMGRPMKAWTTEPGNQATHRRFYIGQVIKRVEAERRIRIRLESGDLSAGETVFFEGPETGFKELTVTKLRLNGQDIDIGPKGELVDVISDLTLHPADRMYRYIRS